MSHVRWQRGERLNRIYDSWLRAKMLAALPALRTQVKKLFAQYETERGTVRLRDGIPPRGAFADNEPDESIYEDGPDDGGRDTFFSWFFRGKGPADVLSGAAFQRNRLISPSSRYITLFEDDYVAWLLERPDDAFSACLEVLGGDRRETATELRRRAFAWFRANTNQKEGYPPLYVFEGYQATALTMMAERVRGTLATRARDVLHERFGARTHEPVDPPDGFPDPEDWIGITTVVTELVKRPALRDRLWPEPQGGSFVGQLRQREQRRELFSAMSRLGAPYIDLYMLAIKQIGSFRLRHRGKVKQPVKRLACRFVALLERQMDDHGRFDAFKELADASAAFDTIIATNFPDVRKAENRRLRTEYGRVLQSQSPVATTSGAKVDRMVRQFRMPGYPLVLISTDVLQEGEDLHTFCDRVIHYGITWTPSAMEQRTGRVDRIGSLAERRLDGLRRSADDAEKIQVHYPYLRDTVEVLQVERVLRRVNRFMHMVHEPNATVLPSNSSLDTAREMVADQGYVPPIEGRLTSAFPIREGWLAGERNEVHSVVDVDAMAGHLDRVWQHALETLPLADVPGTPEMIKKGTACIVNQEILPPQDHAGVQEVELALRSQVGGAATLIRCTADAGSADLSSSRETRRIEDLQRKLGMPKICVTWDAKRHAHHLKVVREMFFNPDTAQLEEMTGLIRETILAAVAFNRVLHPEVSRG